VALLRRFELYKPVIAAVNGFALAGGTEIIQGTDIRLASTNARFGLSEPKRGIVPAGGSMVRLVRQIPFSKAMEILLTGDDLSAEEAHRIGLVNKVTSPARLHDEAVAMARRIADNAPLAVRAIKEVVLRTSGIPLEDAYAIEDAGAAVVMRSSDAREGPRAFLEKRKPRFQGS
jgi:enoyl-CoA hydratase